MNEADLAVTPLADILRQHNDPQPAWMQWHQPIEALLGDAPYNDGPTQDWEHQAVLMQARGKLDEPLFKDLSEDQVIKSSLAIGENGDLVEEEIWNPKRQWLDAGPVPGGNARAGRSFPGAEDSLVQVPYELGQLEPQDGKHSLTPSGDFEPILPKNSIVPDEVYSAGNVASAVGAPFVQKFGAEEARRTEKPAETEGSAKPAQAVRQQVEADRTNVYQNQVSNDAYGSATKGKAAAKNFFEKAGDLLRQANLTKKAEQAFDSRLFDMMADISDLSDETVKAVAKASRGVTIVGTILGMAQVVDETLAAEDPAKEGAKQVGGLALGTIVTAGASVALGVGAATSLGGLVVAAGVLLAAGYTATVVGEWLGEQTYKGVKLSGKRLDDLLSSEAGRKSLVLNAVQRRAIGMY